jgi:hypothetical protein
MMVLKDVILTLTAIQMPRKGLTKPATPAKTPLRARMRPLHVQRRAAVMMAPLVHRTASMALLTIGLAMTSLVQHTLCGATKGQARLG